MAKKYNREEIWDFLISKGYRVSSHSGKILHKVVKTTKGNDIKLKYKFGSNNLQYFKGDFKVWSVPFKHIGIVDDKIRKID